MPTRLKRFKVYNFRSIEESNWVDVSDNTCLIGTNESGKTNLLLALWKLRPANEEPIIPLSDFPRHLYSTYKAGNHSSDVFIAADFVLDESLKNQIAEELNCDPEQIKTVLVKRKYDGDYIISFPYSNIDSYPSGRLLSLISGFKSELQKFDGFQKEPDEFQKTVLSTIDGTASLITGQLFKKEDTTRIIRDLENLINTKFGKRKKLPEYFNTTIISQLRKLNNVFDGVPVTTTPNIRNLVLENIPQFVYYSDYGNLDSEIYLPRVIEDFERDDLSDTARAKVRTLDVLFKYVNLSPAEIYQLGNDNKIITITLNHQGKEIRRKGDTKLTDEEIADWATKKKERGVLLRSAASQLTKRFKEWWLQGDYIFAFEADGSHFRINVSDKLRPEAIELEGRSRGLQWFFSFFLVFLVETKHNHTNTILLLDEPGLSLHPMAQYDLAKFFRKLSEDNQLIYTSHSPFLVDMDNLANVKAVYVDSVSGRTKVSSDLRHNGKDAEKSIYPAHAALGLTVSDTLLLGCRPVLVEGPSDQIYLSMIKRYLMGKGLLKYSRELVFIPVGGVKGMAPVSKLVASRDDKLPYVLLDSDRPGKDYANKLKNGRYKEQQNRVLGVDDFLGQGGFQIEDLIPPPKIIRMIDRNFRNNTFFEDVYEENKPIMDQIKKWATDYSVDMGDGPGWKVEIAREILNRIDQTTTNLPERTEVAWKNLFDNFLED